MKQGSSKNRDVTMMDVARKTDVSYATVSCLAHGKYYVDINKRELVSQIGYLANQHARSLASGRSQVIGLLVPGIGPSYFPEILRGIDQALHAFADRA